jgi:hypothetical protein
MVVPLTWKLTVFPSDLMGAAEITTQIAIVAVPALRPLLPLIRIPSTILSRGRGAYGGRSRSSTGKSGSSKSGTSSAGVCNYNPAMARVGDSSGFGSRQQDHIEICDIESIQLPPIDVGESLWLEENDTGEAPEPWEAITLPRLIE